MVLQAAEPLTARLVDLLYTEAMVLADEARSYFDDGGRADRVTLDPFGRVRFSCESLKVTTRLMHIVAWLLGQRAIEAGEIAGGSAMRENARLGTMLTSEPAQVEGLPPAARAIVVASIDMYARVARLQDGGEGLDAPSPARALMSRLEQSF